MSIKYEFQRGGSCSHWYAIKDNTTVATIDKFDDTNTEINPFKVNSGPELRPDTCFWPNNEDVPYNEYKNGKWSGYYAHAHGDLKKVKEFIEAKFS